MSESRQEKHYLSKLLSIKKPLQLFIGRFASSKRWQRINVRNRGLFKDDQTTDLCQQRRVNHLGCSYIHFCLFNCTYLLWNIPSPRTWSGFLLQTSALTRIVLGLVDRTELSELVPGPQSSRGLGTLGSVGCLCWHQPLRQSSSVFRSIHGDLRSSHLDKNNDSVDETGFAYSLW